MHRYKRVCSERIQCPCTALAAMCHPRSAPSCWHTTFRLAAWQTDDQWEHLTSPNRSCPQVGSSRRPLNRPAMLQNQQDPTHFTMISSYRPTKARYPWLLDFCAILSVGVVASPSTRQLHQSPLLQWPVHVANWGLKVLPTSSNSSPTLTEFKETKLRRKP